MMKKSKHTEKKYDSVEEMRKIRDKISKEIADMDFDELKAYFKRNRLQVSKK